MFCVSVAVVADEWLEPGLWSISLSTVGWFYRLLHCLTPVTLAWLNMYEQDNKLFFFFLHHEQIVQLGSFNPWNQFWWSPLCCQSAQCSLPTVVMSIYTVDSTATLAWNKRVVTLKWPRMLKDGKDSQTDPVICVCKRSREHWSLSASSGWPSTLSAPCTWRTSPWTRTPVLSSLEVVSQMWHHRQTNLTAASGIATNNNFLPLVLALFASGTDCIVTTSLYVLI